jgi:hypothetical protein
MRSILRLAAVLACLAAAPAQAQTEGGASTTSDASAAPSAGQSAAGGGSIALELNKLESVANACRGYFVVDNHTPETLKELQIDVFLFDKDGIILRRVALSFLDVRSGRTKVVLFDLADLSCGDIGRLLVNEVLACTDASGAAVPGCADRLAVTTRTDATFEY